MLPNVPYGDKYAKRMQTAFYGLNRTASCGDGELFDCQNLSADDFPILRPRKKRGLVRTLTKANGLGGRDVLMWVDGTEFFYNGVKKGDVSDSFKTFYYMGPWVIILPDKAFYNVKTDTFGSLEETYVSGAGQISFADGTYSDESAKANSIVTTGAAFAFEVGDAVTITGCTDTKNNITPIIREISEDKKTLRFYENVFHIGSGISYTEAGAVTIKRAVPDMDYICENENRLWGCKGDTIYCCNLGNPKVWNDYDDTAMSGWSCDVGSSGDFTGCASFLGYAVFFKENAIHKVYGDKPSNFAYSDGPQSGLLSGCFGSFAKAGETLFYVSRAGVMRYNGGFPYLISGELADYLPANAVAGTDGRRYYISGTDKNGNDILLCYDMQNKIWLREDNARASAFAYADSLYMLCGNEIWKIDGGAGTTEETAVVSAAEFGDFCEGSPNKKTVSAFQIRAEAAEGATLSVYAKFDDDTQWQSVGTITGSKQMHKLPVVPRRCDSWRLKLEGTGDYKLFAVSREFSPGSDEK